MTEPAMTKPWRTLLFLPASNARAIEKARGLACDAVVLDLEDAVAPEQKIDARAAMVEALHVGGFRAPSVLVRVNALDSEWGEEDLFAAARAAPDGVLIPKVDDGDALRGYEQRVGTAPRRTRLWAMIETCRAVLSLRDFADAGADTRLEGLVVGVNDLAKEMRARPGPERTPLLPALAATVQAARAGGLVAIDGVCNALEDDAALQAQCRQGRDLGFDGKSLIHPRQIEITERAFSPSPEEAAWAREVIDAFARPENADRGAIRVAGAMVERLHLAEAQRILAAAGAALA
jgi:citrate lyase subunit beta/citryl-CoA lyase